MFTSLTALIVVGLVAGSGKAEHVSVGDCVRNNATWPEQDIEPVNCADAGSQYRVSLAEGCPAGTYILSPEYTRDGSALCLEPVR